MAGTSWCKVRTILDELGKPISEVPPGCAAQVTGAYAIPNMRMSNVIRDYEVSVCSVTNAYVADHFPCLPVFSNLIYRQVNHVQILDLVHLHLQAGRLYQMLVTWPLR